MFYSVHRSQDTLPAFLRRPGIAHELRAPAGTAAHVGLAVQVLAALPAAMPVLWVSAAADWYPPGLAWAGIDPSRCLFAQTRDDAEALSAPKWLCAAAWRRRWRARHSRLAAKRLALAARQGQCAGVGAAPCSGVQQRIPPPSPRAGCSPAAGSRLRAELLYAKGTQPGVYMLALEEESRWRHAACSRWPAPRRLTSRPWRCGARLHAAHGTGPAGWGDAGHHRLRASVRRRGWADGPLAASAGREPGHRRDGGGGLGAGAVRR